MDKIEFVTGGKELLPRVKALWEKLNRHHQLNNTYFKQHYSTYTFEGRQKKLLKDATAKLRVILAHDPARGNDVGYCVVSLNTAGVGEIESLYVELEYRKLGLGDQLMKRSMLWLDDEKATSRTLSVAEGNEEVLPFYAHYGFYPRRIVLEYIPPAQKADKA